MLCVKGFLTLFLRNKLRQ